MKAKQLFLTKASKLLLKLAEINAPIHLTEIHKTYVYESYSEMCEIINKFEKLGLVETKKVGRTRIVTLTNLGKKTAELIGKINNFEKRCVK